MKSGDSENLEAQAARRRRPLLIGYSSRRDRGSPSANALLDYDYVAIRASIVRAVVAAGLRPTIGINHTNRDNAFASARRSA